MLCNTPKSDKLIEKTKIVDPAHPFYEKEMKVINISRSGTSEKVTVDLGDGRTRVIPKSVTDIDNSKEEVFTAKKKLRLISVRTLLPLAHYLKAILALKKEVAYVKSSQQEREKPFSNSTRVNNDEKQNRKLTSVVESVACDYSTEDSSTNLSDDSSSKKIKV